MNGFRNLVVGIGHDPVVVGAARAILIYLLPLAVATVVAYSEQITDPRLLPLVPLTIALLRAVEAAIDQALRPTQNDTRPVPPAGAGE